VLPGKGETRVLTSDDEKILWDAATGLELKRYPREGNAGDTLAVFPDGNNVLSPFLAGDEDYGIEEWSIGDGKVAARIERAHTGFISGFAILPGGRTFLSASWDGTVKLWNRSDGTLVRTFSDGAVSSIEGLALSPDGACFLAFGHDEKSGQPASLIFWDTLSGKLLGRFDRQVIAAAFLPDGRRALVLGPDSLVLLDTRTGEIAWTTRTVDEAGQFGALSLSEDGTRALWAGWTPEVKLFDTATGRLLRTFLGHVESVHEACFLNDDRWVASNGFDHGVKIWDVATGTALRDLRGYAEPTAALAFTPDGRRLISALGNPYLSDGGSSLLAWDLEKGALARAVPLETEEPQQLAVSSDGTRLVIGGPGYPLEVWQLPDFELVRRFDWGSPFAISPDGRFLALEGNPMNTDRSHAPVEIRDLHRGERLRVFEDPGTNAVGLGWSPDSSLLYTGAFGGIVYDAGTGKELRRLRGDAGRDPLTFFQTETELAREDAASLVVSPDGKWIATGNNDVLRIFEASTRRRVHELDSPGSWGDVQVFTPDGRLLLASGKRGEILLWETESGRRLALLDGHEDAVTALAVSPDGTRFASASLDGTVLLWDLGTRRTLLELAASREGEWAALTPEGYYAASARGHQLMNVRSGEQVFGIEQFFDVFYRPDLVERKLRGEDLAALTSKVSFAEALNRPPPRVRILAPGEGQTLGDRSCRVRIEVEDRGGSVGDVRLYHQGKLVRSSGVYRLASDIGAAPAGSAESGVAPAYVLAQRGLRMARAELDPAAPATRLSPPVETTTDGALDYEVSLVPGLNTLAVSAFNGDNTILSAVESRIVGAEIPPREPRFFGLFVGIDRFANPEYTLQTAAKDARDLASLLEAKTAAIYPSPTLRVLEDAGRQEVLEAFETLAAEIGPEDIFVFFGASHGLARDDLYYLITSDFDGDLSSFDRTAISSLEFVELSKRIPALRQVYVLDTCQAGGLGNAVAGLYDARLSVLARSVGMHVITGARVSQFAADNFEGNGLFTHHLLAALRGGSDTNGDQRITVFEIGPYLESAVRESSGGEQEVFIRNFGVDLDLAGGR